MKYAVGLALLAATFTIPAYAEVGVSVRIGEPGFYGQIEIGDYPRPRVINTKPIVVEREVVVVRDPIYLRVPPGHRKKWKKYCGRYGACGQPVYFVNENWYLDDYAPRYRRDHDNRDHDGHPGKGHGRKGHGGRG